MYDAAVVYGCPISVLHQWNVMFAVSTTRAPASPGASPLEQLEPEVASRAAALLARLSQDASVCVELREVSELPCCALVRA
jgi:hypothetical protein